jgi:hypothetical protein
MPEAVVGAWVAPCRLQEWFNTWRINVANLFEGIEPPAWLTRMTEQKPGELGRIVGELVGGFSQSAEIAASTSNEKQKQGIKTSWIKELPGSIKPGLNEALIAMQTPMQQMQIEQAKQNIAQQGLEMDNQRAQIDARNTSMAMQAHDQQVLPQWLQDNPTWESRQDATPPTLFTPSAEKMFRDIQLGDAANIKHKTVVEGISAFSKSVDALQKIDPIAAAPFAMQIGKVPTQKMQDDLATAMVAAQEKEKSDIIPRGMVIEAGDRKVSGVFSPKTGAFKEAGKTQEQAAAGEQAKLKGKAASEQLIYARERIVALEKAMNDPANSDRQDELKGQWLDARKYFDKLVKQAGVDSSPDKPKAEQAAPAPESTGISFDDFQKWKGK